MGIFILFESNFEVRRLLYLMGYFTFGMEAVVRLLKKQFYFEIEKIIFKVFKD